MGYAKTFGQLAHTKAVREPTDFPHVIFGKLRGLHCCPTDKRSMLYFVGMVLDGGGPSQVLWVHTSFVALPAGVGTFMFRCWCRAVNHLAHLPSGSC